MKRTWLLGAIAVVVLVLLVVIDQRAKARHAAWERVRDQHTAAAEVWPALAGLGACLRDSERRDGWLDGLTPATIDASVRSNARALHASCVDDLEPLRRDATFGAHEALVRWTEAEHALASAGDQLASAIDETRPLDAPWDAVQKALAARKSARAQARRDALPIVRDRIRAAQRPHGKDAAWWSIEIALAIEDLLDAAYRAHGEGGDLRAGAQQGAKRVLDAAPPGQRAHLQDGMIGELAAGAPRYPDIWEAINGVQDDDWPTAVAVLPPVPPEPSGGCL